MSEQHSITPTPGAKATKPPNPRPDFPLGVHPAGYWCKKIRGKIHYFGPRFDLTDAAAAAAAADAALAEYNEKAGDLHAGKTPRPDPEGVTVKEVVNAFLIHKMDKRDAGELSARTWEKYNEVTDLVVKQLGKAHLVADLRPDDFTKLKNHMTQTKRWGPLRVADFVQHIRSIFKHAYDSELIDKPLRFGPGFSRPSQKTLRLHRAKQGPKLFRAEEVRKLIDVAGTPTKAMILLGINCGYGNADIAGMPLSALDLERGWADYPRPKTGIPRRCPLWPETVEALREALAKRPQPKNPEHAGLAFLSQRGTPVISLRTAVRKARRAEGSGNRTDGLAVQFAKLMKLAGINGRKGLGFYTLRHTFRTVADEAKDQPAADHIMGHEVPHMSSVYRETISDARLKAVTDHVHGWLVGSGTGAVPSKE
jgi:integrase